MRSTPLTLILVVVLVGGCATERGGRHSGLQPALPKNITALTTTASNARIHFVDVGQGDCTLIECPDGSDILIDCGSVSRFDRDRVRSQVRPAIGDHLDLLIFTHPDRDHYNRVGEVLDGITVGEVIYVTDLDEHDQGSFPAWRSSASVAEYTRLTPADVDAMGSPSYEFGGLTIHILAADLVGASSENNMKTNTRSVVSMVSFGEFDLIVTGDATYETQAGILGRYAQGNWLDVEVLRVAHHGSRATWFPADFDADSGSAWLRAVQPELAILSASGTMFGHPHKDLVDVLFEAMDGQWPEHEVRWGTFAGGRNTPGSYLSTEGVYTTRTSGTIVVETNGESWTVSTEK